MARKQLYDDLSDGSNEEADHLPGGVRQFKSKNKRDFEPHQMSFGGQQVEPAGAGGSPSHSRERPKSGGKKFGNDRPAIGGGVS